MSIRFPDDLFALWGGDTLAALSYMHEAMKMVHRDLKPANVLFKDQRLSDPTTLPI